MNKRASLIAFTILFITGCWCAPVAAGPRVSLVLGPGAPDLERLAASELKTYLQRLFDAEVQVGDGRSDDAEFVILLGSPATNPAVQTAAAKLH